MTFRPNQNPAPTGGIIVPRTTGQHLGRAVDDSLSADAQAFFKGMYAAPETRRKYGERWALFAAWCSERRRTPEPATVATIKEYIAHLWTVPGMRGQPTSPETVKLSVAAILTRHRIIAEADPSFPVPDRAALRHAIGAYSRRYKLDGYRAIRAREVEADELREVVAQADNGTLRGVRDVSILTLGFAMMARASEAAVLTLRDVHADRNGLSVHVPYSKTDQEGHGADTEVINAPGDILCPVAAFRRWLKVLGEHGYTGARVPAYPAMPRRHEFPVELRHMTASGITDIVRRSCLRAGLPTGVHIKYGMHSLRSGAATSAARAGASVGEISQQGRWSERSTVVLRYIRKGQGRRTNPLRDVYSDRSTPDE